MFTNPKKKRMEVDFTLKEFLFLIHNNRQGIPGVRTCITSYVQTTYLFTNYPLKDFHSITMECIYSPKCQEFNEILCVDGTQESYLAISTVTLPITCLLSCYQYLLVGGSVILRLAPEWSTQSEVQFTKKEVVPQ